LLCRTRGVVDVDTGDCCVKIVVGIGVAVTVEVFVVVVTFASWADETGSESWPERCLPLVIPLEGIARAL